MMETPPLWHATIYYKVVMLGLVKSGFLLVILTCFNDYVFSSRSLQKKSRNSKRVKRTTNTKRKKARPKRRNTKRKTKKTCRIKVRLD